MAEFIYNTAVGVIQPDTGTTKNDVQGEFVAAFGPQLVLDDTTPQGRLIDIETMARDGFVRTMCEFTNQINPNVAVGVFLEAICGLHGIQPVVPSFSIVHNCIMTGTNGTFIPANSRVSSASGGIFLTLNNVTIGVGGNVTVDLQAQNIGPIEAPIASIINIIDGVLGWVSVSNPEAAIPGANPSTDADLRVKRKQLLAMMGKGTGEAISSNVMAAPGVRSVQHRENVNAATQTIDGVVMTAHSTWVCVQNGTDADIAMALFKSKQSGSPWTSGVGNGSQVSVQITDPNSGQLYTVLFNRGVDIPIAVRVTVSRGSSAADPTIVVPNAIIDYATGEIPGEVGFILGSDVSPFELAGAVSVQNPGLIVRKVEIATVASGPAFGMVEIPIELWQFATVSSGNISTVIL